MLEKTCPVCHTTKSASEFHSHKRHKDGLYSSCKKCANKANNRRYHAKRPPKPTIEERFWQKVKKDGPIIREELGSCWEWQGERMRFGHGRFQYLSKRYAAHRLSYQLAYGHIPNDLQVCHKCDNPPCVRFDHLFVGTQKDNIRDASKKGRLFHGESHYLAKLTEEKVKQIRMLAKVKSNKEISALFSINSGTANNVIHRKTWKHLD